MSLKLTRWDKLVVAWMWACAIAVGGFASYCVWDLIQCVNGGQCI